MIAHGGQYKNALQAASLRGHDTIVRLLLESFQRRTSFHDIVQLGDEGTSMRPSTGGV